MEPAKARRGRPRVRPTTLIRVPETAARLGELHAQQRDLTGVDAAAELIAIGANKRKLRLSDDG